MERQREREREREREIRYKKSRGDRKMVSVLASYSDEPCSNPAGACSLFKKNDNKQNEVGMDNLILNEEDRDRKIERQKMNE